MVATLIQDTFAEYLAHEGLSRGRIVSEIQNSSCKARYDAQHGTETTDPMRLGSAAHCAVLEPDRFLEEYTTFSGRRAGKAWTAHLELWDKDRTLSPDEYAYCMELRKALRESRKFQALREGSEHEVSCYWDGNKARFDGRRKGLVWDLKTAYDLTDHGIEKALGVSNMIQVPHYLEGDAEANGNPIDWATLEDPGQLSSFVFVFVSKALPIEVRLVEVPFEHVKRAAAVRHQAIERIKFCQKRDVYPSYPDAIESFSPKPYIFD